MIQRRKVLLNYYDDIVLFGNQAKDHESLRQPPLRMLCLILPLFSASLHNSLRRAALLPKHSDRLIYYSLNCVCTLAALYKLSTSDRYQHSSLKPLTAIMLPNKFRFKPFHADKQAFAYTVYFRLNSKLKSVATGPNYNRVIVLKCKYRW